MCSAVACGGAGSSDKSGSAPPFNGSAGSTGTGGGAGFGTGGTGGGAPPLPPEEEIEGSFRSPVATGNYVWTTNPESGRVAVVDATTLEVRTVEAGHEPTFLAAIPSPESPDQNRAIVINVRSRDATLLTITEAGVDAATAPLHQGANRWATSATGRFAIAWSDASEVETADPTEGFQDVTVIDLQSDPPDSTRLSVGYRPSQLVIAADDSRAYAVTEPGITVIDLQSDPRIERDVALTDDPLENPASRDVTITPDGAHALVRRDESNEIGLVQLPDGGRQTVVLSGAVTDLDLADTGQFAVAAIREHSEVAILPIPEVFTNPSAAVSEEINEELFGSVVVAPGGDRALLFTNAVPSDRLTIVELGGAGVGARRSVSLKAPIRAVFVAPDAAHAIALLEPDTASSRRGAFSMVPIASALPPKIQGTDAEPVHVAIAPGSDRAVVTGREDAGGNHETYLLRMPELRVDRVALASPPLATGMIALTDRAFVAQEHPEGRITFLNLADGRVRTLTGFELDAQVIDDP